MLNQLAILWLLALTVVAAGPVDWPVITRDAKPWSYWWWMGSAVDAANLTRELERYKSAGWGGVHIIPIYGAKGYETRYIDYLSPQWMSMLDHAGTEAERFGMAVDMTLGTGWCFGGPNISQEFANVVAVPRRNEQGAWEVGLKPTMRVKRAAPGGEGFMLNPLYGEAVRTYLQRFDDAFRGYKGTRPRAIYHDSYEYNSNWSPDLLSEFVRRRGYRLQDEYDALFGQNTGDRAARVKSDYRETLSDMMIENFNPKWIDWSHRTGMIVRNQAHGSPGNLLDLYAAADVPETEMFRHDRSTITSKLASSAAHIMGRKLVASETGTWLKEHFQETFADMRDLVQQLFLSGVNHIIYHGTCFSPDDAPWPGWVFYASTQLNPRNPIWRDAAAFNGWVARSQAMLQKGAADNDILLYWPLYDTWHDPAGLQKHLTVHDSGWLVNRPFGKFAQKLYDRGWAYDFISDRLLHAVRVSAGKIRTAGSSYRVILVPPTEHIPITTMQRLMDLTEAGATVIFAGKLPADVPGWGKLEDRRGSLRRMITALDSALKAASSGTREAKRGSGRVIVGAPESALDRAGVRREPMTDIPGLQFLRRVDGTVREYYIANRGATAIEQLVPLAHTAARVFVMDPVTGAAGQVRVRDRQVYLQLQPGEALFLRLAPADAERVADWRWRRPGRDSHAVQGTWSVEFIEGGPERPAAARITALNSWTEYGGDSGQRFGGTARYAIQFEAPQGDWYIDLGDVRDSARVKLNGSVIGTLFGPPWRVYAGRLRPGTNILEVEVTNVAANRIRDLDRRAVPWRVFHDINVVNLDYKPFDASNWPVRPAGLIGPVTVRRAVPVVP